MKMALLVPTKAFLQRSPDIAILFAPFRCTNSSFPIPLFPLMQSLSPKDIAGSGIMKLRVLRCDWAGKCYILKVLAHIKYLRKVLLKVLAHMKYLRKVLLKVLTHIKYLQNHQYLID